MGILKENHVFSSDYERDRFTQNDTKKYQTGKRQAVMEYMVSGSRNSPPFTTD